jgi:hypothetical protein
VGSFEFGFFFFFFLFLFFLLFSIVRFGLAEWFFCARDELCSALLGPVGRGGAPLLEVDVVDDEPELEVDVVPELEGPELEVEVVELGEDELDVVSLELVLLELEVEVVLLEVGSELDDVVVVGVDDEDEVSADASGSATTPSTVSAPRASASTHSSFPLVRNCRHSPLTTSGSARD